MMLLKEFLSVNHANFKVGIRNNDGLQRIIQTVFLGYENGFNELKLRDYLYDYVVNIEMPSASGPNRFLVTVLHEDEGKDEGKEKEE